MSNIKDVRKKLEKAMSIIGEDIEDCKIYHIEEIYNNIVDVQNVLKNYIVSYRGSIKSDIGREQKIIEFFETYYPKYKNTDRKKETVEVKQFFLFLMYIFCQKGYSELGRFQRFNKVYDHTTIMHAVKTFVERYEVSDIGIMALVEAGEKYLDIPIKGVLKIIIDEKVLMNIDEFKKTPNSLTKDLLRNALKQNKSLLS